MNEINIKSSTIEKGLDLIKEMLSKVMGPAFTEIGELFGDNVKMWRMKNQIRNFEKVKKIVDEQKIDIKQINLKILLPYMEGVSLEEDETLQNMWANLFVNYIDSDKNITSNVYPGILSQISTHEVEILEYMRRNNFTMRTSTQPLVLNEIDFSDEELANLSRLGLIVGIGRSIKYGVFEIYKLNIFAVVFMNACTR